MQFNKEKLPYTFNYGDGGVPTIFYAHTHIGAVIQANTLIDLENDDGWWVETSKREYVWVHNSLGDERRPC